jgi:hypothetical protein
MRDVLQFASPFGFLGRFVDRVFMAGYLRRLLSRRGDAVRRVAENESGGDS